MLSCDFGNHLVLAGELRFQRNDLCLELLLTLTGGGGGLTAAEHLVGVLKELPLPVVKQARLDLQLLADFGRPA
jgi:hypothetical protein